MSEFWGTAQKVIERRAEMGSVCQCLAAWDDERTCVCDKTIAFPLALDKLKAAYGIASEIESLDRSLKVLASLEGAEASCVVSKRGGSHGGVYMTSGGHHHQEPRVHLHMPKGLIAAVLQHQRAELLEKLGATGVITVDRANIRAVPK